MIPGSKPKNTCLMGAGPASLTPSRVGNVGINSQATKALLTQRITPAATELFTTANVQQYRPFTGAETKALLAYLKTAYLDLVVWLADSCDREVLSRFSVGPNGYLRPMASPKGRRPRTGLKKPAKVSTRPLGSANIGSSNARQSEIDISKVDSARLKSDKLYPV